MPPREHRYVDAVLQRPGEPPRIIEIDEKQHFNEFRALTIRLYPDDVAMAFDRRVWLDRSELKKNFEGGGFAKPRPPLFDGELGRHKQRAFRDALCDILPPEHGFLPTLRIAHFEVTSWIYSASARDRMRELVEARGI
jgi:hypothetical protein